MSRWSLSSAAGSVISTKPTPAVRAGQHRHPANIRAAARCFPGSVVVDDAQRSDHAWRVVFALSDGAALRLSCAGLAERRVILQSFCVAVSVRDRRLVFLPLLSQAADDWAVAHAAIACNRLSRLQPAHGAELAVQVARVAHPRGSVETDLPDRQEPPRADAAIALSFACPCRLVPDAAGLAWSDQASDDGDDQMRREFVVDLLSRRSV